MSYKLSQRSLGRLEGVHPAILEIVKLAITRTPFDFGIPQNGGLRTAEQQNEIFKSGASKKDGYLKKSYHQSGKAWDFVCYDNNGVTWDKEYYMVVYGVFFACAAELGYKIRWGGNWDGDSDLDDQSFDDYGHCEVIV